MSRMVWDGVKKSVGERCNGIEISMFLLHVIKDVNAERFLCSYYTKGNMEGMMLLKRGITERCNDTEILIFLLHVSYTLE